MNIESAMLTNIQEHYHFVPGQDCSYVCIDVIRWFDGRVFVVDWYSFAGKDRTGHVEFNKEAA